MGIIAFDTRPSAIQFPHSFAVQLRFDGSRFSGWARIQWIANSSSVVCLCLVNRSHQVALGVVVAALDDFAIRSHLVFVDAESVTSLDVICSDAQACLVNSAAAIAIVSIVVEEQSATSSFSISMRRPMNVLPAIASGDMTSSPWISSVQTIAALAEQ